jgi:hypothetical protein
MIPFCPLKYICPTYPIERKMHLITTGLSDLDNYTLSKPTI